MSRKVMGLLRRIGKPKFGPNNGKQEAVNLHLSVPQQDGIVAYRLDAVIMMYRYGQPVRIPNRKINGQR